MYRKQTLDENEKKKSPMNLNKKNGYFGVLAVDGNKNRCSLWKNINRFHYQSTNVSVIDQTVVTRAAHLTHCIFLS